MTEQTNEVPAVASRDNTNAGRSPRRVSLVGIPAQLSTAQSEQQKLINKIRRLSQRSGERSRALHQRSHNSRARRNIFGNSSQNLSHQNVSYSNTPVSFRPEAAQNIGSTATPVQTQFNVPPRATQPVGAGQLYSLSTGTPWTVDLSKIQIPELRYIKDDSIVTFQVRYKEYLRKIQLLETKYGTIVQKSTVYDCIERKALSYLCLHSHYISKNNRAHPTAIDRGLVHDAIMNFTPLGSTQSSLSTISQELNKIKIILHPDGEKSIQLAYFKLMDIDEKYSGQVKPKVIVTALIKNLKPERFSRHMKEIIDTGTQAEQNMKYDLTAFLDKLNEIVQAFKITLSVTDPPNPPNPTAYNGSNLDGKKFGKNGRSEAAIREGGCPFHGKKSRHGGSECFQLHPELAPAKWNKDEDEKRTAEYKARTAKAKQEKLRKEQEKARAMVANPEAGQDRNSSTTINPIPAQDQFSWMSTLSSCAGMHNTNAPAANMAKVSVKVDSTVSSTSSEKPKQQRLKIPTKTKGKHSIFIYTISNQVKKGKICACNTPDYYSHTFSACGTPDIYSQEYIQQHYANAFHHVPINYEYLQHPKACLSGAKSVDSSLIWDSGATHSIVNDNSYLEKVCEAPFAHINGLDGKPSPITGTGQMGNLKQVLMVPDSQQGLISVGSYLDQCGGKLIFTSDRVSYENGKGNSFVVGHRREDGLYSADREQTTTQVPKACLSKAEVDIQVYRDRIYDLHRLLGHCGKPKLKQVITQTGIGNLQPHHVELLTFCEACKLGNAKFLPKNKKANSHSKATCFGERIMADNAGPSRVLSIGKCKYLSLIVDEFSSWVWTKGLHTHTANDILNFVKHVIEVDLHQRSDRHVKFFRSDGGGEYVNKSLEMFLREHGIKEERSCPYSSFQNGKAERHIGIVFAMMRKALYESRLPPSFWLEGIYWAVYTHNRLPMSSRKDGKSPFELRYGYKPDLTHLRPFGARGALTLEQTSRNGKHLPTGVACIMIGYGYVSGQKGYRVWIPSKRTAIVSLHVAFDSMYSSVTDRRINYPLLHLSNEQRQSVMEYFSDPHVMQEINSKNMSSSQPDTSIQNNNVHSQSAQKEQLNTYTKTPVQHSPDICTPKSQLESDDQVIQNAVTPIAISSANATESTQNDSNEADVDDDTSKDKDCPQDSPLKPLPKGYEYLPTDHEFFKSPKSEVKVPGDSIAERNRNRRRGTHLSAAFALFAGHPIMPFAQGNITDCHPTYVAYVAHAADTAKDMASDHPTPKYYGEAMRSKDSKHWRQAIQDELSSIRKMDCYDSVSLSRVPEGANIIGFTWVFKVKKKGDGTVERYKARICVDGSKQKYGIDYKEVFSPVATHVTIRLALAIAMHERLVVRQFDIKLAFVSSDIDQPVYMRAPSGSNEPPNTVWKLKKSLYGLKQAPRLFNTYLNGHLVKLGFTQSSNDPCLYFRIGTHEFTLLVIVVDDILMVTSKLQYAQTFETNMKKIFELKSMGEPSYMIGMNLQKLGDELKISQEEYIREITHRFDLQECKPINTPASATDHLVAAGLDEQAVESPLTNEKNYRSLVGALMYAVISRPDVACAVSIAARFLSKPRDAHLKYAKRILRYLYHTRDLCLTYRKTKNPQVTTYVDSSWSDERDERRSRFGYAIFYGKALIHWKSKLGVTRALSSTEAEYSAATHAAKEVMWINHLLSEIGRKPALPVIMHEDNQSCIKMAANPVVSARTKYLETKMHFIRDRVHAGEIELSYIPTKQQLADIMTKNLPRALYIPLRDCILDPGLHVPVGMC